MASIPPLDPSTLLRVGGPAWGWIPALGGWNDPPKADRLPSGGGGLDD